MAKTKKPPHKPSLPFPSAADALHQEDNWLWIPLRKEWRDVTTKPEEIVRQKFIRTLVEHYGYALEQMDQERRTQHGHKSPRADIVIWQSATEKEAGRTPVLVIECKTDTIDIQERDYYQGESYTRAAGCEFFIATNARHTAVFKLVPGLPGGFVAINEIPKASDWGDAKRLKEIRESLRTFNRKEFQDLLFVCHSILRDVHKMDPGRAFDTISKILFIKMYIERSGLHGTFTVDYLDQRAASRMPNDPQVHDGLFDLTKDYCKADDLFAATDKLEISETTFRRIVKELQRFDLSKTGDDIKGLAFEKFLGTTFRGELGQFFTPRPVVEFMVDLLNPQEKQLICDPASGSGGFLIRAFEHVRAQIVADVQRQKDEERARIEALGLPEEEEERQIEAAFSRLNHELLPSGDDSKPITLAYVGMSAMVEADIEDTIFPDKVIRVRPDLTKIEPQFLWRLLQVPSVRAQIEAAARTAVGNFAIGGKDIKALKVPLPLLEQQKSLAQTLSDTVASVKTKRTEATTLRNSAWAAFESALFTPAEPGAA
ncbi:MAG: type I restriction enzyme HsdR N-terminal domain-containing protein [Gammaproteobacteria bacterium]|nr:type I restriction enzyme HsdR N-terminal domain-containing protein [Gammaproteobacteria bacterium]